VVVGKGRCDRTLKLLVIERREPREGPVNSSGSSLEAHPDCLPAVANCCHSLLLDPIGYTPCDLHDWLFLLVSGGEKSPQSFR
jgi:hypothetical protein